MAERKRSRPNTVAGVKQETVKVEAPVQGFNGLSAGVMFTDGKAETSDPAAISYFRRAGYKVSGKTDLAYPTAKETPKAENVYESPTPARVSFGAPLRDAAVEPKATDFLAPTNAGKADPHGPMVVSPQIHADGPKGIKPGDVHVDDTGEQEKDETALAQAILVEGQDVTAAMAEAAPAPTFEPIHVPPILADSAEGKASKSASKPRGPRSK